jgi:monooxygenase
MTPNDLDVLIVGAGISGISAAYHLQTLCPGKTFALLERRERMGGTWDLFRYPGIRSDSDMYTLGFSFRPWTNPKAIADAPDILAYLGETARAYGIDRKIRYGLHVKRASWSSDTARWTVEAEHTATGEVQRFTVGFLFMCSGYYNYDRGYQPDFPGMHDFGGRFVHPQFWPEDLDYAGKRVVVIGSGATAITLVPSMAKTAGHVTMLQRSPTYVASAPAEDAIANWLREHLPGELAYGLTRAKNISFGMVVFAYCRRFPEQCQGAHGEDGARGAWARLRCREALHAHVRALGPARVPGARWRLLRGATCSGTRVGGDRPHRAHHARRRTAAVGRAAARRHHRVCHGPRAAVPERPRAALWTARRSTPADTVTYKGMMFSDVPNLAMAMGYTNASWTLKCDLTSAYVCRLLNHVDAKGVSTCCPELEAGEVERIPFIDFTSGYVQRALDKLPKQGSKAPWKLYQNYVLDLLTLRYAVLEDGAMRFSGRASSRQPNAGVRKLRLVKPVGQST